MKIEHKDGNVTDTDKLTDIDSMLIEKAQELKSVSAQANKQLFLLIECTKTVGVFWNLTGKDTDEKMKNLHQFLDDQIKSVSNDVFRVVYKNPDQKYVMIDDGEAHEMQ